MRGLRAAFNSVFTPFAEGNVVRQGEAELNEQQIDAPELRELMAQLDALHSKHAGIGTQASGADDELRQAEGELARLRARITERELELARSGSAVPEAPFEEDADTARAERRKRVLAARVRLCGEEVSASQAQIDELKHKLESAWVEWGAESYRQGLAQLRAAEIVVRDLYVRVIAWRGMFSGQPASTFPSPGVVVIEDPYARSMVDRFIIHSDMTSIDQIWRPLAGDLPAALQALRAEIDRAKAGKSFGQGEKGE
ncbi:MAG TPA: hypothetical protein VE959_30605 [Bryobacteraceae bacterium]|nr:hypothetical protein [Bryobacteraceae bacterium]